MTSRAGASQPSSAAPASARALSSSWVRQLRCWVLTADPPRRRRGPIRRRSGPRTAVGDELPDHALHVVGQVLDVTLRPRTVRPRPASSRSSEASPPPRWTWKPGVGSPSGVGSIMPLSPMSAVWIRAQELGQPLMCRRQGLAAAGRCPARSARRRLQLGDGRGRGDLGFDDGELAELDAGAGDGAAAEHGRAGGQAQRVQLGHERLHLVLGHVEDHELLVRGGAQPVGAAGLQGVRELDQLAAGEPAGQRGGADEEPAVLLLVDADVVAGRGRLGRGGAVGELVAEVFVLQDLAELLRSPVGQQELQPCLGAHPPVAVVAEDAGHAEPDVGGLLRAARTRRAACRAWGWWRARRPPRGRSRRRVRGGPCPPGRRR